MRISLAAALGGAVLAGCSQPTTVEVDRSLVAIDELSRLERAFSARSETVGAAQAWAEYVDPEEGMLFGPTGQPAIGRDAIFKALGGDEPQGTLTWKSEKIWAAKSGELAASWGHWTFTPTNTDNPTATGRYVTLWRRDPTGTWKALVDIGHSDSPAR